MEFRVPGPRATGDKETLVRFGPLRELAAGFDAERAIVVADPEALRLHGLPLPGATVVVVPRGEAAKSLPSLEALYASFLERELDRSGSVLAFGGGATCDLAGFAAATWLRGVSADYAPTTLLAMVDASLGGKTGIDFHGRKNLIGAFSSPRSVLVDVACLDSLDATEFASGMGEVIKHAVLAGGERFEFLESIAGSRPFAADPAGRELLERLVADSIAVKAGVVVRDPLEKGERRLLNLGHSFGHALESGLGLPHGHAVAAGLATACRLAFSRAELDAATLARVTSLLEAFGLPSSVASAFAAARASDGASARTRLSALLAADKKREGASVHFVLPRAIGRVEIATMDLAALSAFLEEAP